MITLMIVVCASALRGFCCMFTVSETATKRWWDSNPSAVSYLFKALVQHSSRREIRIVMLYVARFVFKVLKDNDVIRIFGEDIIRTLRSNPSKTETRVACDCLAHLGQHCQDTQLLDESYKVLLGTWLHCTEQQGKRIFEVLKSCFHDRLMPAEGQVPKPHRYRRDEFSIERQQTKDGRNVALDLGRSVLSWRERVLWTALDMLTPGSPAFHVPVSWFAVKHSVATGSKGFADQVLNSFSMLPSCFRTNDALRSSIGALKCSWPGMKDWVFAPEAIVACCAYVETKWHWSSGCHASSRPSPHAASTASPARVGRAWQKNHLFSWYFRKFPDPKVTEW